ncbi:asparagine synthase (glutamine-hydrolyzing) [Undibacter mobilis]|uniref:asparagine synthase (glutamine-hydrolyzing) n=1 Tax=Undibacter mobilis TaxID=2292256 RepID=A0A371B6B3_9BRAD|nr:asparagine synthase (glutamine-hydrolyzing) [Undibacter mobilis]RDV03126.1 asparagine synthase (glutamine-hydrolyzing) [Undibacter mobilis]
MCGIAGLLNASARGANSLERLAKAMGDAVAHRGPDDYGVWSDPDTGVAMTQRRLSIVDLSPAGHQPMISANGRYVIVYNGEIYNFLELRAELEARGVAFRGHSDTEVMLEAFAAYGIEATVKRLIGMFAIAVWDKGERTLTLVRDRLGIKPLYWAKFGGLFIYGSELKALRVCPGWEPRVDRRAVASYLRHDYVPAPHTIYEGVQQLEPGTILTLPWGGEPKIARFWNAREIARNGISNTLAGSDAELTDRLEALLTDAVQRRMIADVPLGAFLSGGVDSSTVVALMQKVNASPVKTFSIGFDIPDYNEAQYAASVARHLKTDHTELTVTSQQARDVIPKLADMYDEPFADSSQIPTYLVSALTRQHVTVALSGDGGDELFAGYTRYQLAERMWRGLSLMPLPARRGLAASIRTLSPDRWTRLLAGLPARLRQVAIGDRLHKFAEVLDQPDSQAVYRRLVTHWEPGSVMPNADEYNTVLADPAVTAEFPDLLNRMQFLDLVTYLPNDILTKVDRASMAVALEARVPLIDHRVVEFAWQLPRHAKIRNGTSKWLLREVLYRHVPKELIERPKMGFGIPLGDWLRGPLRDWAENLLDERRLTDTGLLDARRVREVWQEHLSGKRNWQYLIWNVLMLEAWRDRWMTGNAAPVEQ